MHFFYLTHFRELGQKYKNIFVRFLVQMKTSKFAFEINWPLESTQLKDSSKQNKEIRISKFEYVKRKIELTTTVFFLLVTKNRLKLNSGFFETWEPELLLLWLLLELRTSKILDVDLFSWMTEWNCDVLPTGAQRFVFTRFFFDNV